MSEYRITKIRHAPKIGIKFYNRLRKNLPLITIPSAAQIRALNETLQILLIAFVMVFEDSPTRLLTIIALILIRRRDRDML